jgi:hypothetical protein
MRVTSPELADLLRDVAAALDRAAFNARTEHAAAELTELRVRCLIAARDVSGGPLIHLSD